MYRARAGVREYTAGTGVSGSREKANSEKSRCRIQSCSLYCKDVHLCQSDRRPYQARLSYSEVSRFSQGSRNAQDTLP